jgi:hypothetical protein
MISNAAIPAQSKRARSGAELFLLCAPKLREWRSIIPRVKSRSDFALHQPHGFSKDLSQKFGSQKSTEPSGERPQ